MNEDYITFDFANGKIEVHNNGEQGTIEMPDLSVGHRRNVYD